MYPLVRELAVDGIAVTVTCRVLKIARQPYYRWLADPVTDAEWVEAHRANALFEAHADDPEFGYRYLADEAREGGQVMADRTAWRICSANGWWSVFGKPKPYAKARKAGAPAHEDLVARDFSADEPNRLWLTDITLVPTGQGRLRAAVVLDAYNREVISWAVDQRERPTTALRALTQAIRLRRPAPGCVVHSDRGYQFTAHDWLGTISAAGLSASIGERHSALDNAMMESWFASFKNEALYPYPGLSTFGQARILLLRYIHLYNTRRLHSALGYLTPLQYASING